MSRPRLVATDLDGTLLDADGAVTERTARAWRRLGDAGILSVIVTARPPRWVDHLAGIAGEHGVVLCGNGAFVYDVARREVLECDGLAPEEASALIESLHGIEGTSVAIELVDGFHREADYPANGPGGVPAGPEHVGSLRDIPSSVGKILARSSVLDEQTFLHRVREVIGDRARLSTSCAGGLAEIGPRHVTKARALAAWCARRGIGAGEVWAFGDMPNDIPMLRWSGTGWAVANAHPAVHAVADRVCGANTEDGVARALEEMLSAP